MALAVEKLIFNSKAALFIVHPVSVTLFIKSSRYSFDILAYFKPCLPTNILIDLYLYDI